MHFTVGHGFRSILCISLCCMHFTWYYALHSGLCIQLPFPSSERSSASAVPVCAAGEAVDARLHTCGVFWCALLCRCRSVCKWSTVHPYYIGLCNVSSFQTLQLAMVTSLVILWKSTPSIRQPFVSHVCLFAFWFLLLSVCPKTPFNRETIGRPAN